MKRNGAFALTVLVSIAALLLAGCPRPRYKSPEQRADRMVTHLSEKLELDELQQAELERIKEKCVARHDELRAQRNEVFEELSAQLERDRIDQQKLDALIAKKKTHATEMIDFIAARFTEIHTLLTPEQRQRLITLMEEHRSKGHHRWHH